MGIFNLVFGKNKFNEFKDDTLDPNDIEEWNKIEDLEYNDESKVLKFQIIHYTKKPKITRYIQENYVRIPIYEDYSIRTKTLKKFNQKVNIIKFCEEDLLNYKEYGDEIINSILRKIDYVPFWRKKENKIFILKKKIQNLQEEIEKLKEEKIQVNLIFDNKVKKLDETKFIEYTKSKDDWKETSDNFILNLFVGFFCFFANFLVYTNKKEAIRNKEKNIIAKIENEKNKIEVDNQNKLILELKNKEIDNINEEKNKSINLILEKIYLLNKKINLLDEKIEIIKLKKIEHEIYEDNEWINLRKAVNITFKELDNLKGVYLIRNKTKEKYYVGQSKNLKKRIFYDHFKNGEVNNIIFAKDWFDGDDFFVKWIILSSKDELDKIEKENIEYYNSFKNGYNSTGGNY